MLAALARCVPQDSVNPFVSAATLPTLGMAFLIVWAGSLWLLQVLFRLTLAARSVWGAALSWIAVLSTIAIIPVAAVALWIWLQARSFIPWCAPVNTSVRDAQHHSGDVAFIVGFVAFAFSLLVVMGSSIAVAVISVWRHLKLSASPEDVGWGPSA